jgi:hypothetical protein
MRWERNFTQVPNEWLRDTRLTFRARGLMAWLLSHQTGYKVTLKNLARDNREGLHALREAVLELEKHGYLTRTLVKGDSGHSWRITDPHDPVDNSQLPAFENRTGDKTRVRKSNGGAFENRTPIEDQLIEHEEKEDKRTRTQLAPVDNSVTPCGHELIDDRHCVMGCQPRSEVFT